MPDGRVLMQGYVVVDGDGKEMRGTFSRSETMCWHNAVLLRIKEYGHAPSSHQISAVSRLLVRLGFETRVFQEEIETEKKEDTVGYGV